jgi:hypothetical protein
MVTRTRTVVVVNKCQCATCLDIIESRSRHAFVQCKCGAIFTDGGTSYIRRGGKIENIIDMSETYEETFESEW